MTRKVLDGSSGLDLTKGKRCWASIGQAYCHPWICPLRRINHRPPQQYNKVILNMKPAENCGAKSFLLAKSRFSLAVCRPICALWADHGSLARKAECWAQSYIGTHFVSVLLSTGTCPPPLRLEHLVFLSPLCV